MLRSPVALCSQHLYGCRQGRPCGRSSLRAAACVHVARRRPDWTEAGEPWGTYSVSESSRSDTAGTTLSTGVHAGLTQVRPRRITSCTYLGNNPCHGGGALRLRGPPNVGSLL